MGAEMNVAVLIPYRPVDEHRELNFECVRKQYDTIGWPVIAGDGPDPTFSRSAAINNAAEYAKDADVLLITDGDLLLHNSYQAVEATVRAQEHNAYVAVYSLLRVLDWEGTRIVRGGGVPPESEVIEEIGLTWGGCFAVTRALFDEVGGFDERFAGWGHQDIAFMVSCSTLQQKMRVPGGAWHLRHNSVWDSRADNPDDAADGLLGQRYLAADGDRDAILAILAER
jgi:glycosyltransferase involved in cell wall biosynthesis